MPVDLVIVHIENNPKLEHIKIPIPDIRSSKYIGVHAKSENKEYYLQQFISVKINNSKTLIALPNEISLALNISNKAKSRSIELIRDLDKKSRDSNGKIIDSKVEIAYDYLEEIQKSVVFGYKAIEAFCNATIPDDFVYEKTNNKGVVEKYQKEQIERWVNTTEKVSVILPKILGFGEPKNEKYWSDFKNLERLRNEIIHSKSSNSIEILHELFSENIYQYLVSAFNLLEYFIKLDPYNPIFPLGFGVSDVKVPIVNTLEEFLAKRDSENEEGEAVN